MPPVSRANKAAQANRSRLRLGISSLARALGTASTTLCHSLILAFGEKDGRSLRAQTIDGQLQPLVKDLKEPEAPGPTIH